ncbi:MAG TPA: hypothetical protein VMR25_01705 [Planctomycetaceae bacterium]|jgi:hypothetical protein|nr:hypothetical protein [Planctomycetaceae bacterium]
MEKILSGYTVDDATWLYLSLVLTVTVYFRFSRVFSLRNADLVILLAISPGILLVHQGSPAGFVWLFGLSGVLVLRLIGDRYFTRRPRLEQNLNNHGLSFLGIVAFLFLAATAWNLQQLPKSTVQTVEAADRLSKRQEAPSKASTPAPGPSDDAKAGPAATVLAVPFVKIPQLAATINPSPIAASSPDYALYAARLASIVAHLAVAMALIFIARWHFGDQSIGIAMATLYLLLPCTAYDVARVNHVFPAALILWAIAAYRRPAVAGGLMGLACGTLFFPVFLLPLWFAFYDRRGAIRFGIALGGVAAVLVGSLALTSVDVASFRNQTMGAIDWSALSFRDDDSGGFWRPEMAAYRIPVFVAFLVGATVLSLWPRKKTLEQLIAHSTAIIVATQFWYPQRGGVYSLWYLPLLLVVVFRPTLSHLLPPDLSRKGSAEHSNGNSSPQELATTGANGAGAALNARFR